MLPVKAPRDPAPSRLTYRLERLWLRPAIRIFVRLGLPAAVLTWVGIELARDPDVRAAILTQAEAARAVVAAHPALRVERVELTPGLSAELQDALAPKLAIDLPVSSIDLDLDALHARVIDHAAVESAQVRIEGGVLLVTVQERRPELLWRHDGGVDLIDAAGRRIGEVAHRGERPDLPIIAGDGANKAAAEALRLLAMSKPIEDRVRGLIRIGERRWSLKLRNGIEIMLPEDHPERTLGRVIQLHETEDLLSRALTHVDMRDPLRPTLRMKPNAVDALHRIRLPDTARDA